MIQRLIINNNQLFNMSTRILFSHWWIECHVCSKYPPLSLTSQMWIYMSRPQHSIATRINGDRT